MVSASRRVAHRVLLRVFEEDAYADRAFSSEAKGLDARDRAFAQRIAYGSIQMVRTLDNAIEALSGRQVGAMDPPVRAAIRLGAYELGFLGGVPPRASVNEAVELVKASPARRAAGFANAVLRRAAYDARGVRAWSPLAG
ncbi:MAG TPA: transcription antitermination protein NusB, partial [Gaiellaceae bacterium]|nr:transcription antitermination protein NusB [Gaiellaceae bacterium]